MTTKTFYLIMCWCIALTSSLPEPKAEPQDYGGRYGYGGGYGYPGYYGRSYNAYRGLGYNAAPLFGIQLGGGLGPLGAGFGFYLG